jgi:hypothetical protein
LEGLVTQCVPGAKILDLCEFGIKVLEAAAAKLYTKKVNGKTMDRGVAFPVCISVNDTVCNFSPLENEEVVSTHGIIDPKYSIGFVLVLVLFAVGIYPVQVHFLQVGHELAGSSLLRQGERRAETDPQTALRQEEKREEEGCPIRVVLLFLWQRPGLSRITPLGSILLTWMTLLLMSNDVQCTLRLIRVHFVGVLDRFVVHTLIRDPLFAWLPDACCG